MFRKLIFITIILFPFGCRHEEMPDLPLPEIFISSPVENAHFEMGDVIHITGNVTHTLLITEVAVHMVNIPTGTEFFHHHFSAGGTTTYDFEVDYIVPNNVSSSFRIEVEATDVNNSLATEEMEIRIN